ncbi:MAG: hypothetical protein QHH30_05290 [candidate division NC10 bacterium]|nr:hypothetical protein [candidate division NC10 bacterium]
MKVLHLPSSVGGNPWGLAQGERALGLDSSVLVAGKNWPNYPADVDLHLETMPTLLGKLGKLIATFWRIRGKYDILHFNFGHSLLSLPSSWKHRLPSWFKYVDQPDLSLYPRKTRLFVTYHGCDARQKYATMKRRKIAPCHDPNCYGGLCNSGRLDEYRRHGILRMARHVEHMWALNPDLLDFLPPEKSSFLPYTISGWTDLPLRPPRLGRPLRIAHAPTNREAKGSDLILNSLKRIDHGHPGRVEILWVEEVVHEEALKRLLNADLVVDQILIGWYGGVAVEAMKMGKPVIARIALQDLDCLPPQMARDLQEAIIPADPDTIHEVLSRCIQDGDFLRARGSASFEYVNRWHDPVKVAAQVKEKYEAAMAQEKGQEAV